MGYVIIWFVLARTFHFHATCKFTYISPLKDEDPLLSGSFRVADPFAVTGEGDEGAEEEAEEAGAQEQANSLVDAGYYLLLA